MKILMVSELYPQPAAGGLAKHMLNLANYYSRQGHHVDLLGNEEHQSSLSDDVESLSGIFITCKQLNTRSIWRRVERRARIYSFSARVSATKAVAREIAKRANAYDAVHYHGHYALLSLYVPEDINFVVTHHDFNLICPKQIFFQKNGEVCNQHVDTIKCGECALGGGAKLLSIANKINVDKFRRLASRALGFHKHVFVSKRNLELTLSTLGKTKSTGYVVHNFINCKRVSDIVKESKVSRSVRKRIVLVNYIAPHKGVTEFVAEYVRQITEDDGFELLVGGDGPERGALEEKYSSEGVKILGPLGYKDAIELMETADICVVPSLWEESCSTAILEGLYLGKKVLALMRGGTVELKAYECYQNQLMIFRNLTQLVHSLKSFRIQKPITCREEEFRCCVEAKAKDIMEIYLCRLP